MSQSFSGSISCKVPLLLKILLLLVTTSVFASPVNDDSTGNDSPNPDQPSENPDFRIVRVVIQDYGIRELTIPTNGQFAWDELNDIDIPDARIISDVDIDNDSDSDSDNAQEQRHTTCFFWRSYDEGNVPYATNDAFVSPPIYSTGRPARMGGFGAGQASMTKPYRAAERIYCYDSTAEQTGKNMVTVFVQNVQQEHVILRLPVSAENKFYTIPMSPRPQSSESPPTTSSSSSSSSPGSQDDDLRKFSDPGVSNLVVMYAPQTNSYCMADAGPQKIFVFEMGNPLKFQPAERVFELRCRY